MAPERQKPHDVLAAEEFAVPAPDPELQERDAHDVLAAEEFVVPAPDPGLRQRDAHDVLAAEEFALPGAGSPTAGTPPPAQRRNLRAGGVALAAGLVLVRTLRRRRTRRRA